MASANSPYAETGLQIQPRSSFSSLSAPSTSVVVDSAPIASANPNVTIDALPLSSFLPPAPSAPSTTSSIATPESEALKQQHKLAVAFPSIAIDRYGFLVTDKRFRSQLSPVANATNGDGFSANNRTSSAISATSAATSSILHSGAAAGASVVLESSEDIASTTPVDSPVSIQNHAVWLENQRTQKWIRMIGSRDQDWYHCRQHQAAKLKSRIRKGIPDALRGRVWCYLAESTVMMAQNPGVFRDLLLRKNATWSEVILRDIGRTFPKHCQFQDKDSLGQNALYNVLRAYSIHDVEVGYCQGMGFLTAMFLSYLPEEQSFWQLVACLNHPRYDLANLFRPGMPKVAQVMEVFDRLLKRFLPALAHHLEVEGLHPTMYSSQWFITLFTYSFPFEFVTRVWDIFLNEGWKIIYRVALALMKVSQSKLMALKFEGIMLFLRDLPTAIESAQVFEICFKIKLRRKQLVQLEAECSK